MSIQIPIPEVIWILTFTQYNLIFFILLEMSSFLQELLFFRIRNLILNKTYNFCFNWVYSVIVKRKKWKDASATSSLPSFKRSFSHKIKNRHICIYIIFPFPLLVTWVRPLLLLICWWKHQHCKNIILIYKTQQWERRVECNAIIALRNVCNSWMSYNNNKNFSFFLFFLTTLLVNSIKQDQKAMQVWP